MNKFQPEAPSGSPLTTAEAGAGLDPTLTRTGKVNTDIHPTIFQTI